MDADIDGVCEAGFEGLGEAFRSNFADGLELGASLSVMCRGRTVVDLWGGWADPPRTRPWERDTLVPVASTGKIAIAMAVLKLVGEGRIELDAPVARYWREFAQGGKAAVTVRDALAHSAGVPGFDPPIDRELSFDWDAVTARLAAQTHWFGGARKLWYHMHTYGFLLGELVRRVDGRGPADYFHAEITRPGAIDFHMGLTDKADMDRVAALDWAPQPPRGEMPPPGSDGARFFASGAAMSAPVKRDDRGRWKELSQVQPAGNALANGRSIARLCSILAMGGALDGRPVLSPEVTAEAMREQAYEDSFYVGWLRIGLGLGLHSAEYPAPSPTCAHWGGLGGSWGLADPATGLSLGYAPNNWNVETVASVGSHREPRQTRFADALEALLPTLPVRP
jgi:CubicO group peptidase (beta-lactamase class C family)